MEPGAQGLGGSRPETPPPAPPSPGSPHRLVPPAQGLPSTDQGLKPNSRGMAMSEPRLGRTEVGRGIQEQLGRLSLSQVRPPDPLQSKEGVLGPGKAEPGPRAGPSHLTGASCPALPNQAHIQPARKALPVPRHTLRSCECPQACAHSPRDAHTAFLSSRLSPGWPST